MSDESLVTKWSRFFNYALGRLPPNDMQAYKQQLEVEAKAKQCTDCNAWKQELINTSPIVRFMIKEVEKTGCKVDTDKLTCSDCDATRSGGFDAEEGIVLCQNRIVNKQHLEDTMAHELVHVYDHCKFKVDWTNCFHHACSEVCVLLTTYRVGAGG
jgi:inner membrane protease ATP23